MKSKFTGPDGAGPVKSTSIRRPIQNTNRPTNNPIKTAGPGAPLPSIPSKVISHEHLIRIQEKVKVKKLYVQILLVYSFLNAKWSI